MSEQATKEFAVPPSHPIEWSAVDNETGTEVRYWVRYWYQAREEAPKILGMKLRRAPREGFKLFRVHGEKLEEML